MKTSALLLLSTMALAPLSYAKLDPATDQALSAAMQHANRNADNQARDKFRKPKEVLDFLGFRQDMTVVEIWPGTGWYSEILAPALKDHGKYYAAQFSLNPAAAYQRRALGKYLQMLADDKQRFGNVQVTTFQLPDELMIAPPASADMVLTFRNAHNWLTPSSKPYNALAYKAMFDALKPGGILGVVDHQWDDPTTEDENASQGYVSTQRIKQFAAAAGFEFVAESDVLDNAKDTKDHPRGVWTLPPTLALGDKDAAKYKAIGESDRFVLKFRKPM